MTTAQLVRLCLDHHRSMGMPFDKAWQRAMQSIPRSAQVESDRAAWVTALRWARPAFRAAYERADEPLLTVGEEFWKGTPAELRAVVELRAVPETAPPEMVAAA